jgi:hypothetical protein
VNNKTGIPDFKVVENTPTRNTGKIPYPIPSKL